MEVLPYLLPILFSDHVGPYTFLSLVWGCPKIHVAWSRMSQPRDLDHHTTGLTGISPGDLPCHEIPRFGTKLTRWWSTPTIASLNCHHCPCEDQLNHFSHKTLPGIDAGVIKQLLCYSRLRQTPASWENTFAEGKRYPIEGRWKYNLKHIEKIPHIGDWFRNT